MPWIHRPHRILKVGRCNLTLKNNQANWSVLFFPSFCSYAVICRLPAFTSQSRRKLTLATYSNNNWPSFSPLLLPDPSSFSSFSPKDHCLSKLIWLFGCTIAHRLLLSSPSPLYLVFRSPQQNFALHYTVLIWLFLQLLLKIDHAWPTLGPSARPPRSSHLSVSFGAKNSAPRFTLDRWVWVCLLRRGQSIRLTEKKKKRKREKNRLGLIFSVCALRSLRPLVPLLPPLCHLLCVTCFNFFGLPWPGTERTVCHRQAGRQAKWSTKLSRQWQSNGDQS